MALRGEWVLTTGHRMGRRENDKPAWLGVVFCQACAKNPVLQEFLVFESVLGYPGLPRLTAAGTQEK